MWFELSQLGQLSGLGGSPAIHNLDRIQAMEEAREARIVQIKALHKLTLEWDADRPEKDTANEENSLEILMPHSYLQYLCIRGHGGTKCPQWLGENLSVKNLESLHLDGVAWNIFPPIGELWLANGPHEEISSNVRDKRFQNLKRLELVKLPRLKKWVVDAPCQLFAHLEVLIIQDCSKLEKLSFSHSTCCQHEKDKEANMNWFPSLRELKIENCPGLLSFPPIPWTSAPCSAKISGIAPGLDDLVCRKKYGSEYSLYIRGLRGAIDLDGTFWNVLAFGNLSELELLQIDACPPLPLHHFRMLSSLKTLELRNSSSIVFPLTEGESRAEYQFAVECVIIEHWGASAKELTQLLTYFSKLSELNVGWCEKITVLGVVEKQAATTPADVARVEQQERGRREEEIAAEAEGLLLLPSQLQKLRIVGCRELILRSDPVDDNREAGRAGGGQGLQGLTSLRSLNIGGCPRFLSYSSSSPCFPFPTSLEHLTLGGVDTLLPLSNLTSLVYLCIYDCGKLRVGGLRVLIAQCPLTKLNVQRTPNFFAGSEPTLSRELEELPSSSSKLQELDTDDVAGVLAAPICSLLSSSLTGLSICWDKEVERFTKDQEEAIQLLTSMERISVWFCNKLRCLPAGLHRLPNLKRLDINGCQVIRSLPKDGFPGSLQELVIEHCPGIRWIHKECLPNSLQKLVIRWCPTMRSLPKVDDLPSSLQELDVYYSNSEELRWQCRKLIGTIPIVRA
jgi:Leucine-rich repeat (LRR) protein